MVSDYAHDAGLRNRALSTPVSVQDYRASPKSPLALGPLLEMDGVRLVIRVPLGEGLAAGEALDNVRIVIRYKVESSVRKRCGRGNPQTAWLRPIWNFGRLLEITSE